MKFKSALDMTGQKPFEWLFRTFLLSLFMSIIFSVLSYVFADDIVFTLVVFISVNLLILVFSLLYVYYKASQVIEEIDLVLPDYLDNVAGYIKAGFSPILALKSGLREEYGILNTSLNLATIKSLGPTPAETEILKATSELGSDKLQRILTLFLTSYISGGKVGVMLERIANDLREANELKKKLVTGVNVYIIFISLSLIFILPLIISVSLKFLEIGLESEISQFDMSGMTTLGVLFLTVSSMLTGMFIGAIRYGRELMGFKHSLYMALLSNVMFVIYSNYVIHLLMS
ncbi:type II secretion system F family protein [Candidatus Micrarchaeota archaeon]|nr:type II secretion system F family protein [Candidatus Micrarchaeota archaeon]